MAAVRAGGQWGHLLEVLRRLLGAEGEPAAQALLMEGVLARCHIPCLPCLARLLADRADGNRATAKDSLRDVRAAGTLLDL